MRGSLKRLRLLRRLEFVAEHAGRADAACQLGRLGSLLVATARADALAGGCLRNDVDDMTVEGIEAGRRCHTTESGG